MRRRVPFFLKNLFKILEEENHEGIIAWSLSG